MQYLLFPLFLGLLYSATFFIPKSPPPTEIEAPQTKPTDNPQTSQPAMVKGISPLTAPSEYVGRKGDAPKQENGAAQGQESEFEMVAPSEPVEKKEEAKEATSEIAQQDNPEEKQDTDIAMAAPSEPVNEATTPETQARPEEGPTEKQQATEEKSPMLAPSEPVELKDTAKEEAVPEQKVEQDMAMAAPSEAVEKREPTEVIEAKAIEETPPQNKAEEEHHEKAEVVPAAEEKAPSPAAAAVEKPEAEEETEPLKEEELKITAVKVKKLGKLTRAEIVTSGKLLHYNIFSLDAPDRVVVDVKGATKISVKKRVKVVSPNIKKVRLGQHDKFARVVFDYKGKAQPYEVIKDKDRIIIFLGKKPEFKPDPEKKLTSAEGSR